MRRLSIGHKNMLLAKLGLKSRLSDTMAQTLNYCVFLVAFITIVNQLSIKISTFYPYLILISFF